MSEVKLTEKKCQLCEGIGQAFTKEQASEFLEKTPGWQIDEVGKSISREYVTKNFMAAVNFINKVAEVA